MVGPARRECRWRQAMGNLSAYVSLKENSHAPSSETALQYGAVELASERLPATPSLSEAEGQPLQDS